MAGFKSFLKTFGMDAVKVAESFLGAPKVIVQELAQGNSDIKALFDLVKQAETIANALKLPSPAGSQKLAMIKPDLTAAISDVEILGGTKLGSIIKDETSFNEGISDLNDALVKILNACGD